jgi:hypothetical protein
MKIIMNGDDLQTLIIFWKGMPQTIMKWME